MFRVYRIRHALQMIAPTSEFSVPVLYALNTTAGTYNVSAKFVSGSHIEWHDTSYTIAEIIAFTVEDWDFSLHLVTVAFVEYYVKTTWENATIYVYDNGTLMTTVLEGEGGTSFYWWLSQDQGIHTIALNITNGVTTFTKTKAYYVPDWAVSGLMVRREIETFQNNYTLIRVETNLQNCTWYVYLNGSLIGYSALGPSTLIITRPSNAGILTDSPLIVKRGEAFTEALLKKSKKS